MKKALSITWIVPNKTKQPFLRAGKKSSQETNNIQKQASNPIPKISWVKRSENKARTMAEERVEKMKPQQQNQEENNPNMQAS